MKMHYFWGQYALKIAVAILFLMLLHGYVDGIARSVAQAELQTSTSASTEASDGPPFLLTASGLIAAGAVSGFFRFQYPNIAFPRAPFFCWHMAVGHLTTLLQFLVVGVLVQTVVACLRANPGTAFLWPAPWYLFVALMLSMIGYDLYDFLVLWHRQNEDSKCMVGTCKQNTHGTQQPPQRDK